MAQKQFKIGLSNTDKQNMAQDVYERVLALTFAEYDSAETYNEGDFVVYNDLLYKCLADNVTGTWDATKWQQATLQDVVDDVENAVASVDGKANVDGNYPTMTVGMADNLTPCDESAGDDQDEPFILQATGTGNGSQPDFSTGSAGLMKEKQGNTVVVNQIAVSRNSFTLAGLTITNTSGKLSISGTYDGTAAYNQVQLTQSKDFVANHKYLIMKNKIISTNWKVAGFIAKSGSINAFIHEYESNFNTSIALAPAENESIDITDLELFTIDLTQWFNGDIPQDLLDHPENFFRYYQGSLTYNEGALVNADGRYIKCIGMNQWDEEWELGNIAGADGLNTSANDRIRSKNYIKVIPNTIYYIKTTHQMALRYYDKDKNYLGNRDADNKENVVSASTRKMPSNCCYIRFVALDFTTYNNDISINLYYEDEPRCLTYEPYQVLTNNDTGTEVLRKAGNVKDTKDTDGTLHGRILNEVLDGTVSTGWRLEGTYGTATRFSCANIVGKPDGQIISNLFRKGSIGSADREGIDLYGQTGQLNIQILTSKLATADVSGLMSYFEQHNVQVNFEKAEETTEQGTPYSENLVIDDFGSMDFGGTNGVPQGALIFYPVDYKAFVDALYKYSDGTPSDIAKNSELNAKFESYLKSLSGYDASATQTLKNISGTLTWVTEGE